MEFCPSAQESQSYKEYLSPKETKFAQNSWPGFHVDIICSHLNSTKPISKKLRTNFCVYEMKHIFIGLAPQLVFLIFSHEK